MSKIEELKLIRDRRYKVLLSSITILVISLFYNPFIGDYKGHWLLVVRLILAVISYIVLVLLVQVVAKLESNENENKGISSLLMGTVFTILAIAVGFMAIMINNDNFTVILSIPLLFIGLYAVFDGFMIMINYTIKNLRGKRRILEFVLKVVPLLGSIIIGLSKVLFS